MVKDKLQALRDDESTLKITEMLRGIFFMNFYAFAALDIYVGLQFLTYLRSQFEASKV